VIANGFIGPTIPFRDGVLITFNSNIAPAHVIGTGQLIALGTTDTGAPIHIELIEPDPAFAAFAHGRTFAFPG